MSMRHVLSSFVLGTIAPAAFAAVAWNETSDGDLSNAGLSPTFVALASGSNQVIGSTGDAGSGIDLDYFTVNVPTGAQLTSLKVLPGTLPLGSLAFIGVQSGSQLTVSPSAASADGLLGWTHYSSGDANSDILGRIGTGFGASGFTGPLGAGSYAFWVQDFNPGASAYGFDLTVSAVPEPAPAGALALGLLVLCWVRRPHGGRSHRRNLAAQHGPCAGRRPTPFA
jgi:hypothetical protein